MKVKKFVRPCDETCTRMWACISMNMKPSIEIIVLVWNEEEKRWIYFFSQERMSFVESRKWGANFAFCSLFIKTTSLHNQVSMDWDFGKMKPGRLGCFSFAYKKKEEEKENEEETRFRWRITFQVWCSLIMYALHDPERLLLYSFKL